MARFSATLALCFCLVATVLSLPFEQKTGIELKEKHDFFGTHSDNPFTTSGSDAHKKTESAKIYHEFAGGKNWAAGGYMAHEKQTMFGQSRKNNEGGFEFKMKF